MNEFVQTIKYVVALTRIPFEFLAMNDVISLIGVLELLPVPVNDKISGEC